MKDQKYICVQEQQKNKMAQGNEDHITIPMGGLSVASASTVLRTFVGSCVAVCIFDPQKKVGGMAHVMLPRNNTGKTTIGTKQEGKFADEAIEVMLNKINEMIPRPGDLKAKIVGGAKIFNHESDTGILNIGSRNVSTICEILQEKNIPLMGKVVGKGYGRWVTFFCSTQKIVVKDNGGEQTL